MPLGLVTNDFYSFKYPLPRAREYEEKVLGKPEVHEKNGAEEDDDPEPIIIMPEKKRLHWDGLTCECLRDRKAATERIHRFSTSDHSWQSS